MMLSRAKGYLNLALIMLAALIVWLAAATPANALLDSWPVGDGHEGAVTVTASAKPNHVAPITAAAAAGSSAVTIGTVRAGSNSGGFTAAQTQFEAGRLVLVIQTAGYPGASAPSGAQSPINISAHQVGQFEIARIQSYSGSTVTLTEPLANSYAAAGAQIVAIPEYTTFTVNTGFTVDANAWNGTSGGITAIVANGAMTLSGTARISADAQGFRGATIPTNAGGTNCVEYDHTTRDGYKGEGITSPNFYGSTTNRAMGNRANGAGGGNCENAGGGGGGNGGMGGQGGLSFDSGSEQWPVGGLGGQNLVYSALNHASLGGGGGSGDANNAQAGAGGHGGGIVFVRAQSLAGGTLSANGAIGGQSGNVGASDGAGGGGAGGVVYARFAGAANCTAVTATGGTGGLERSTAGVHGPGGGGGGGYIYLQKGSGTCSTNANAGAPGQTQNGENAGSTRGAGPASPTDPSAIGESAINTQALAAPTASVSVPAASQTMAITSNFSGTSTPASTIRVHIDGTYRGSTISDGIGNWVYTTSALAGGAHTMYVIPVNLGIAGAQSPSPARSFTVDATPPAKPVITSPAGNVSTNNPTPTVSGTAEALSTVAVFDGAVQLGTTTTTAGGAWSFTIPSPLSVGAHVITARATDPYNNQGPLSDPRTITYDNVAPTVTIALPVENAFLSTATPSFTFSADEAGTATCQVDSGAQTSCSSPWVAPATPQGPHTVTIRVTDAAGNTGLATRAFTLDTTAPGVSIDSPESDGTFVRSSSPPIAFTITDVNPSLSECRVDGGSWGSCTSPWTTPTRIDGFHTVEVRHTDKAGNVTVAARTMTTDTVLPTISITQPADSGFTGPTPTYTFNVNDVNPGTSYCQMDGGAEIACTSGGTWGTALAPGGHTLAIRHDDAAGNKGSSTSVSFTVDTVPPVVTIDAPTQNQLVNTTSPQALFTVTDANPSPTSLCKIDSGAAVACTSPYVMSGLSQGAHTLTVSHTDKAGNSDAGSTAVRDFTVDSIGPNAPTFTSSPADPTNLTVATFDFTAAEPGGHLECQLDDLGWNTSCGGPQAFAGLALGEHSFFVRQIDDAGNYGTIATHNWVIDQTPPPAPIVSGPSGVSGAPVENFTFYNSEQGVTFTCQLDADPPAACNSLTFTTGTLADGAHSFSVFSTDAAGNVGPTTTLDWETNLAQFNIAITGAPDAISRFASGEFNFSATIAGADYFCKVDSGSFAACSSPFAYGPLSDGEHTFSVYAQQGAEQTTTASRTWTVDAEAPQLTISQPAEASTTGGNLNVLFSASDNGPSVSTTCKYDGAPAVDCTSPFVLSNLSSGAQMVKVTATDLAGNTTEVTRNWTVDNVPPSTSLTATPPAATNDPDASFAFTADKAPATFECSLDGGGWIACTSPHDLTLAAEGVHNFAVRATTFGNVDPAPASYSWHYDTTAPAKPTIADGARIPSAGSATLHVNAEAGTTVELFFDANPTPQGSALVAPNGNASVNLTGITDGIYQVCARATDEAGNTSACSDPVTLVVDTVDPTVSIDSPADATLVNSSVITFSGSDTTSQVRFECQAMDLAVVEEPAFETCAPPDWQPELISGHDYAITVRAFDELDNTASTMILITFDNTPPQDLVISSPLDGTHTNNQQPTISGSVAAADAGATVTVDSSGNTVCQAVAAGDGSWSCSPPVDVPEGSYTITATAEDAAGNVSPESNSVTVTIDVTAPDAPVIATPADGSITSNLRPTISGTIAVADAGATVTVSNTGGPICQAIATGAGNWSCTPGSDLAEATHTLTARAQDLAGNQSADSTAVSMTVDATPPAQPQISSPADGTITNVNRPSIQGTIDIADTGATITVSDAGGPLCQATAGVGGNWNCTPTEDLADGEHSLTARAGDAAGNLSPVSSTVTITVDTVAPSVPQITSPANGLRTKSQKPQVSGTIAVADAGATVTISDGGGQLCQTIAGVGGNWSCAPTSNLSEGVHVLSAVASDAAGNSSAPSTTISITIDLTAPAKPQITAPTAGTVTSNAKPAISGTVNVADAGSTVVVSNAGGPICQATADGSGNWSCTPGTDLAEGSHVLTATATDTAGNDSPVSDGVVITIDVTAPTAPAITAPTDGLKTNNQQPTISGTSAAADAGATITVSNAGGPVCQTTTAGDGSWNCAPGSDLAEGDHTLSARAQDAAGNLSAVSNQVTITVDITPPAKPTITTPTDGTQTNNPKPTISGTAAVADAGATITVSDAGGQICQTTINGAGSWSCAPAGNLSEGVHVLTATATDAAGNDSPASDAVSITLDFTAPNKPTITDPITGAHMSDQKPTVSGSVDLADAGASVTVWAGGIERCQATAAGDGSWSCEIVDPLDEGDYTLTAKATDAAGNTSAASDPVLITIDNVPFTVWFNSGPQSLTKNTTTNFSFEASKKATFQCKLDDGAYAACGSGIEAFTGSTTIYLSNNPQDQGQHTLTVVADRLAEPSSTPATWTWTLDSIAPSPPTFVTPAAGSYVNTQKPLASGQTEADAGVTVRDEQQDVVCTATADSGGAWSCTATNNMTEAAHSFTATATDAAGNESAASAAVSFTIDITPPVGTVNQQPGSGLDGAAPIFIIGSNEPGTTFLCSIDSGAPVGCTSPWTPPQPLAPGGHTLRVTLTDRAGNTSTQDLAFTQTSAPPPPPPPPAAPVDLGECFPNGITITELVAKGSKVTLSGFARSTYVGQKISIYYKASSKKPVATAVVNEDNSFKAKFKAPKKKLWKSKKTAYRVQIGKVATRWTQLSRRMATTDAWFQSGKLIVRGKVTKPLYPKGKATISVRVGCNGKWTTAGSTAIKKSGSFNTTLTLAPDTAVVFIRVQAIVAGGGKKPKKIKTYSFVIPARTQ